MDSTGSHRVMKDGPTPTIEQITRGLANMVGTQRLRRWVLQLSQARIQSQTPLDPAVYANTICDWIMAFWLGLAPTVDPVTRVVQHAQSDEHAKQVLSLIDGITLEQAQQLEQRPQVNGWGFPLRPRTTPHRTQAPRDTQSQVEVEIVDNTTDPYAVEMRADGQAQPYRSLYRQMQSVHEPVRRQRQEPSIFLMDDEEDDDGAQGISTTNDNEDDDDDDDDDATNDSDDDDEDEEDDADGSDVLNVDEIATLMRNPPPGGGAIIEFLDQGSGQSQMDLRTPPPMWYQSQSQYPDFAGGYSSGRMKAVKVHAKPAPKPKPKPKNHRKK